MTPSLNEEQSAVLDVIKAFVRDDTQDAFILRGSAGTGKTTLVAHLVVAMKAMNLSVGLLAPTGRATRILANKVRQVTDYAGQGQTIHRTIYAPTGVEVYEAAESANDPGIRLIWPLREDDPGIFLFVVDEASMVGDKVAQGDFMQFGSGRLLKDLVTYSRLRRPGRDVDNRTKLLFVGDPAQLPPVGDATSPALSEDYLRATYGLRLGTAELKTILRQALGSAILDRATEIRDALHSGRFNTFSLRPDGREIESVNMERAIEVVVQGVSAREATVAIVRANATALEYNRAIRERIWRQADLSPQVHDTLLVNKNSHLYNFSNGDLVRLMQVDARAEQASVSLKGEHVVELRFRNAVVAFREGDGTIVQTPCLLLENLLNSPNRELSPLEIRALLVHFQKRHPDLHPRSAAFRSAIRGDPYFNALQVKYGYAMTCHKAQGGEWHTALVDFGAGTGVRNADFFRWAYTAITRAARRLVVVNPPEFTSVSDINWDIPLEATGKPDPATEPGITTDPDWVVFSFHSSIGSLMPIHQHLRAAWLSSGIGIERLQHLQYCERYTLLRNGRRATVQYHYDGRFRVGRSATVSGTPSDAQLAEEGLAAFLTLGSIQDADQPEPFIIEFLARLDAAVSGSSIRRTGHKMMPYRLRVSFSDASRKGEVDFTYDGSSKWTAAQEVGGSRSSQGLYEEIHGLLAVVAA